jgi:hypothetical protein
MVGDGGETPLTPESDDEEEEEEDEEEDDVENVEKEGDTGLADRKSHENIRLNKIPSSRVRYTVVALWYCAYSDISFNNGVGV